MLPEAIEQRAAAYKVQVDARVQRGRDNRHALRQAISGCAYDRLVLAAAIGGGPGFDAGDIAWLLQHAPGEILVLRAADVDHLAQSPEPIEPDELTTASTRPTGRIPRRGERVLAAN